MSEGGRHLNHFFLTCRTLQRQQAKFDAASVGIDRCFAQTQHVVGAAGPVADLGLGGVAARIGAHQRGLQGHGSFEQHVPKLPPLSRHLCVQAGQLPREELALVGANLLQRRRLRLPHHADFKPGLHQAAHVNEKPLDRNAGRAKVIVAWRAGQGR